MGALYITAAGYAALREERAALVLRRREVVAALSAAAAEGDRSENAEYIYRKKELREVDRRLRYLDRRIRDLRIADQLPADRDRVFFGAWVELEDELGERRRVRIVGSDESRPDEGRISIDAPLARALLKRRCGDEFEVQLPAGDASFRVCSIRYEDLEA